MSETAHPAGDLPSHIGKYDIVSLLGRGAMGVVYQAYDALLDRQVALKVMLPQVAADPDQKGRFEREARAAAKIVHPNVLTVFDLGYHADGSPYLAMELLRGRDLLETLREGTLLPIEERVNLLVQLLDGLAHAHQAGVVHRDIKPANVFLTVDGTVKIMDFGVARLTMSTSTNSGLVVGTPDYMSPEQVRGEKVDGRSDLWSVACMLHEMLTGKRPFTADTLMTVFYKITHDAPDPELPAGPELDPLRPIVRKALTREVDKRYQTAAEFATDLRAFLKTRPPIKERAAGPALAPGPAPQTDARLTDLLKELAEEGLSTIDLDTAAAAQKAEIANAPPTIRSVAPPKPAPAPPAPPKVVPAGPPPDPTPLFREMRDLFVAGKSGHLHFAHDNQRRSLFFLRGNILHGTSDVEGEHLGQILVRYGYLSQEDLGRVTPIVLQERKRLGTVLSDLRIIDKAKLEEGVALHVRDILFSVLERTGWFGFEELSIEGTDKEDLEARMAPGQVILEAARRLQAPDVMAKVLGDLDRAVGLSTNARLGVQKLTLSPTDGFLLSRLDGITTAREIFQIIPLPQEDVERSLFALLCTGMVEYVPRTVASRARAALDVERVRTAAPEAPASAPAPPIGASAPPTPSRPVEPPPGPAKAAIIDDTAYSDPAVDARRKEILDVFEGLGTRNHFELLGVDRKAKEAEIKAAYFRVVKTYHPDSALDQALADLRPQRDAVFLRATQAYETLRSSISRGQYERLLDARTPKAEAPAGRAAPTPAPEPPRINEEERMEAAQESLRTAQALVREGKSQEAVELLGSALAFLQGRDLLRARVTLARAYMKIPKWMRRAEEVLHAVLQESADLAEAHVAMGELYVATNQRARATTAFRKALEVDPKNAEAKDRLEALAGGSKNEPPAPPASGFKKIFGKR